MVFFKGEEVLRSSVEIFPSLMGVRRVCPNECGLSLELGVEGVQFKGADCPLVVGRHNLFFDFTD